MTDMPFFLLAGVSIFCFAFLAVGALVFVACVALPPVRRIALSAALWCAMWGPCLIVWMTLAGMVGIAAIVGADHGIRPIEWQRGFGLGLGTVAILSTAVVATVTAWLHQILIRRMTFALFRIYATLVSAGIGSVYGWALALWLGSRGMNVTPAVASILVMALLIAAFGYLGFRLARQLRGKAPERFTWITPEEFDGTPLTPKNLAN